LVKRPGNEISKVLKEIGLLPQMTDGAAGRAVKSFEEKKKEAGHYSGLLLENSALNFYFHCSQKFAHSPLHRA
jgi:hypothetical protein